MSGNASFTNCSGWDEITPLGKLVVFLMILFPCGISAFIGQCIGRLIYAWWTP